MVSDLNIFAQKGLKLPRQKKFFTDLKKITFEVPFKRIFPPLPEVGCPKVLEFRNPWGNVMERNGLRCEHFCSIMVKNCRGKKSFSYVFFLLLCSLRLNVFFAPNSRSSMCKLFRFFKSFEKSNGKKWSQI